MIYKTRGIIIKRKNFGEADRLLTVYTESQGKIIALAKGARRLLSKLGGHLELFYLVDLMFSEGRNLETITGVVIKEDFPELRKDSQKTNACYHLAEVLDKLTKEGESSQKIFDLMLLVLKKLDQNFDDLYLRYFELKLLDDLGYHPELDNCLACHQKLENEEIFFDCQNGGILHKKCLVSNHICHPVSVNLVKILRLIKNNNIDIIDRIKIDKELNNETKQLLNKFLEQIIECELKSIKFLR